MNFALAVLIYLIAFAVLLWAFAKFGMGLFSALTLTALLSGILMLVMIPPSEIEHQIDIFFSDKPHKKANDYVILIYLIIMLLSLLLISAYIIFKAFEDRDRRVKVLGDDYMCDFKDYLYFW